MTPDQMTELAARLKRLSSDYAFMNAYPGAAAAMANAADLIESMAQRVPLSEEEILKHISVTFISNPCYDDAMMRSLKRLARAIEQAHGIGSEK